MYAVSRDSGELEGEVGVDGENVGSLVDTGAGVRIIQQDHVRDRLGKLQKAEEALRSYSGDLIETPGILNCKLEFRGRR